MFAKKSPAESHQKRLDALRADVRRLADEVAKSEEGLTASMQEIAQQVAEVKVVKASVQALAQAA